MNRDPQQNNSARETISGSSPSSSLDDVRRQLQSFGYLNSRIERFYLLSLSRTASQFLNRVFLSFRVGLLTGTLAAMLMTFGTLVFNEGLLQKKLDIVLLFLYFEMFFVLLFTLLELVLMFLVSVVLRFTGGRRLFAAGQAISLLIGLAFFFYFFYWARTQTASILLYSNFSLAIMFLILTLSCIFVAKCSWLGFLVAFGQSEIGPVLPNWKRYSIEVLLSLTAVLMLVPIALSGIKKPEESSPPVAVLTTSDRWIVLGIDGLSLEVVNRFAAEGRAPQLEKLSASSFTASLKDSESTSPPVTWTTIATGVPPAQHGILMPEVRRWRGLTSWMQVTPLELAVHSILVRTGLGQRQPVSGYSRKVKTFWEILSDAGIRVGVVNWWGSWPAQSMRGWNISERYYYKLTSGGPPQEETYPPDLFHMYQVDANNGKISGRSIDQFYAKVFLKQLQKEPVRVAALYLPGFDILNYEFFEARRMDPFTYTDLYRKHLSWLDEFMNVLVAGNPGYKILVILSPGRSLRQDTGGVMVSDFPPEHRLRSFSEADIMPLLLYTCGLPVSKSMGTELIRAAIPAERLQQAPLHFVSGYAAERPSIDSVHAGEFNDLLIEQMKSLGYLQ